MPTTTQPVDLSQLDNEATRVLDSYRRTRGIYERTEAAMGRVSRYRVTLATTTAVVIRDGKRTS
jgi:hypothetical protein